MIHVINFLSSSLGRRDESANVALAQLIVNKNDKQAVIDLIQLLQNKDKKIQHNSIKVLYEIGSISPDIIAPFYLDFVRLLQSKDNRLQWGAMTALDTILTLKHDVILPVLPQLITVAEHGSVITRDKCIAILIKYLSIPDCDVFHLLNEQLLKCPTNQLPMYAEQASMAIPKIFRSELSKTLTSRLSEFDKESKKTRVEKVIKKLQQ